MRAEPVDVDARIREVDEDIRRLYDQCIAAGYSQVEIYRFSAPLVDVLQADGKRLGNPWKKFAYLLLLAAAAGLVGRIEWSPIVLSSYGRTALIHLLPYWDWTRMYYQDCFVRNPYYEHRKLLEDDCQICEPLDSLPRISKVTHYEMAEDYLKSDVPVIIEDGLDNWNVQSGAFSSQNISKVLLDIDPTGDVFPCTFSSNLRLRGDNYFRTLLLKLQTDDMNRKRWYAHWENCEKKASKALRSTYPRPYFLPPMVDTTDPNWVFLSSNYKGRNYKEVSLLSDMLWLAQLQGATYIRLKPRTPCNESCLELDDILEEGTTLVFTDRMWIFQYLPGEEGLNIAIGGGGSFEI